jgi:protein transport protein SEC20
LAVDEQTASLRTTTTLYQTYSSLLTTSNSLLSSLESSNYTDRILILGALFFFLLVCAYILKRRIWDRTVGGALGWIFGGGKIVKKGVDKVIGEGKGGVLTATKGSGMITGTASSVLGAMQTGAVAVKEEAKGGVEKGREAAEDLLSSVVPPASTAVSSPVPADEAIVPLDPPEPVAAAALPRDEL